MQIKSSIEFILIADNVTYRKDDHIIVKTEFLEKSGRITNIGCNSFELAVEDNEERLIDIKFENVLSIQLDD